jgi:plasmid stabilization system protein ParE
MVYPCKAAFTGCVRLHCSRLCVLCKKLTDDILVQSERLAIFPRSGRIVPELSDELIRELIIASYRLIYGIVDDDDDDDDTVIVLALVHSKRDLSEGLPR